jgi:CRP/FNR family transcriptional regulator
VIFVRRGDFFRLVAQYPEMQQAVIMELSKLYSGACEQLKAVAHASAPERLARLLLSWCADGKETTQGTQVNVPLTHEEIAEFVGTTRETVIRTLSMFKAKHLVTLQGSMLRIPDRAALKSFTSVTCSSSIATSRLCFPSRYARRMRKQIESRRNKPDSR